MVKKTENKGAFQKEFKETKQHCKNNAEDTETLLKKTLEPKDCENSTEDMIEL